jgi:mannose-6-phosphate isomerase-like protein (cupin superfamily)
VSIPEFLDKNYIRREPLKESVLSCSSSATTRLLQMHENIAEHTHADLDEALYIVAGEGAIRINGESTAVTAGSLTIVPHTVAHSIERRGKNPLMVLSMLSGAPCRAEPPPSNASNSSKK